MTLKSTALASTIVKPCYQNKQFLCYLCTQSAMLLANFLWTLVFTTTAVIATLQTSPPEPPNPSLLSSIMDRLDHQQQQWEKEKQTLRAEIEALHNEKQASKEAIRVLQEDVHDLQIEKQDMRVELEALQNEKQTFREDLRLLKKENQDMQAEMATTNTLTQSLAAENQDLKSQLGHLQRQMVSMDMQMTSLRHQVAQCGDNAVSPDTAGGQDTGDQHSPREQSARASSISAREGMLWQGDGPRPQHQSDSRPIPHFSDPDNDERHVQSARSDDQGPLQVVVDHLAATTTQLTSDLQAMTSQHASDIQALTSQHASDIQALTSQHTSDVQTLKTQITAVQAAQGSVFVQWGSSTCSGSSDLVYSGAVGGSSHSHTGAAANTLCLSMSPTLVDKPYKNAYLYGAEFETGGSHQNVDPLCAVCRSHHSTTVMVPGTNVCPSGWSLMYSGYLMAGEYDHTAATEFICVDSKLEGATGSSRNDNGHLLYYSGTYCGSLPCPPYENGKSATCAVCSK